MKHLYKNNIYINKYYNNKYILLNNITDICINNSNLLLSNHKSIMEGYIGDKIYESTLFTIQTSNNISLTIKQMIVENICLNCNSINIIYNNNDKSNNNIITTEYNGSSLDIAFVQLMKNWNFNYETLKAEIYAKECDKIFAYSAIRKKATSVIHRSDGSIRIYVLGNTETLLTDCTSYMLTNGTKMSLNTEKKNELRNYSSSLYKNGYDSICFAYKDYSSASHLPLNWKILPPDNSNLCVLAIIGISDVIHNDVKDNVMNIQMAGIKVRLITGIILFCFVFVVLNEFCK
jgi:magnesium-transporting ATPase (P-type)